MYISIKEMEQKEAFQKHGKVSVAHRGIQFGPVVMEMLSSAVLVIKSWVILRLIP